MKDKEKKLLIILISLLIVIDQVIKIVFLITKLKIGNKDGFSLGVLSNEKSSSPIVYILVYIIAIMSIIRYIKSENMFIKIDSRIILSFSIAGAISNSIDLIWNKGTINYINIPNFAGLNLGYMYFFVTWIGMAIILTKYTRERILDKKGIKYGNKGKK